MMPDKGENHLVSKSNNKFRIVVIGAGIVGVSTAIWLQRDGHDVVLLDREGPAAGTSYGNGGVLASSGIVPVNSPGILKSAISMIARRNPSLFIRWSYLPKMFPWLIRYLKGATPFRALETATALTNILHDSLEQHQALTKGTKAEKWLKPSDYLYVYDGRKDFEKDQFSWSLKKKLGYNWDELDSEEFGIYDPLFKGRNKFAIRQKNHGHVTDPGQYVSDLVSHFEAQGGELIISEALDVDHANGKITGVKTHSGIIFCEKIVLAAGVWSTKLAKKLGVNTSMETERGYHVELINPSHMPRAPLMVASGKFVVTPMEGRLRCAGFVEFGGLEATASKAPTTSMLKQIAAEFPNLTYDHVEEWMGHRPAPSDSIPLIGPIKTIKGAYAAFGHHHVGLTGGPKTGRMIADMIAGRKNNIDLAPYDVSRFTIQ